MSKERDGMPDPASPSYVFGLLEGRWLGEGKGGFPTIESFHYSETLIFERRDENSLFYMQRTEKRMDGRVEFVMSHWESGFIRVLMSSELELANVQSGGRGEVLIGTIERMSRKIRLDFRSKLVTNDECMVASARLFEIDGDTLRYEMTMHTTRVDKLTRHLVANLQRSN
jgi:hypothetical protein